MMKLIEDMTFAEIKQELEERRIPKDDMLMGFSVNDLIEFAQLLKIKSCTEQNLEHAIKDFNKIYKKGFDDCDKLYKEVIKTQFPQI